MMEEANYGMEQLFESWNPGEPVSQVDPEDLKAVGDHISANPHEKATGVDGLKHLCKPGADIWAGSFSHYASGTYIRQKLTREFGTLVIRKKVTRELGTLVG
jgi:hypothetical protein